jgi:hypothetical protein
MTARKPRKPRPVPETPAPPTVHEAFLESGASGAVLRGAELDEPAAVARRQAGEDIVVCGSSIKANRRRAFEIESAVGPCERQEPHDQLAGPRALPHFQQTDRSARGHSFYETEHRKAKPKP